MKKLLASLAVALPLAGCVTYQPVVPQGYTGPVAVLKDSVKPYSGSKADFFYVDEVDGKKVANSRVATILANQGRGMSMKPEVLDRQLPTHPLKVKLVGRTGYAAPILEMTNTVYQLEGELEFTPEANKTYTVRGELGEASSAVWIEDDSTRTVVGQKIEKQGSAKKGLFGK